MFEDFLSSVDIIYRVIYNRYTYLKKYLMEVRI